MHDDVKKKVQKNLRARASRSRSRAPLREDIANTIAQPRPHASAHVLISDANRHRDARECTHSDTISERFASRVKASQCLRRTHRKRARNTHRADWKAA
ncbi:hypothetical protein CupriaWKF_14250 [Cupriavidus sp. WKF15]|uniref:hypothetical protein n=1 Tax=Cupriavidus sp. WKF15 TaxID=3032282 RepID=UPI0023E2AE3C|nr:hypothetical protein [Cupriavidus sp. WKF15]WER45451.1 hypothetical protein CupriaWKF_14250 [Cupriavidus sp. WKF15]